jgi:integrase
VFAKVHFVLLKQCLIVPGVFRAIRQLSAILLRQRCDGLQIIGKNAVTSGSGRTSDSVSLTHRSIEALRPREAAYRVPDQRCVGLAVRVAPSGLKTWDLAYRIRGTGKMRRLSLGRVNDVNLDAARQRANDLTRAARAGRDLVAEEEQAADAAATRLSVQQLIDVYVRRRVHGRLRSAKAIESRLKRALQPILGRYVQDLARRDIRALLDAVVDQGFEREAEQRRTTVGAMFRWALSQDMTEIDVTAGLKGYGSGPLRDRVLSPPEIAGLWVWLESGALPPEAVDIFKLQLLTGARAGEISGLRAEEIDQDRWVWTLPAARSKNKLPRLTPLVGQARAILQEKLDLVSRGPLFLAETGTVLSSSHVGHFLLARRKRLPIAKFTSHDLRRTVATCLVEMGVGLDLVAAVIGHQAGGKQARTLVRHYVRTDLLQAKGRVLAAWDARLMRFVAGGASDLALRASGHPTPPSWPELPDSTVGAEPAAEVGS